MAITTVKGKRQGGYFIQAATKHGYGLYGPYKTKRAARNVIRRYGWTSATID